MTRIRPRYALAAVVAGLLFGYLLAWLAGFGAIVEGM